jgi:hypothetical protein
MKGEKFVDIDGGDVTFEIVPRERSSDVQMVESITLPCEVKRVYRHISSSTLNSGTKLRLQSRLGVPIQPDK